MMPWLNSETMVVAELGLGVNSNIILESKAVNGRWEEGTLPIDAPQKRVLGNAEAKGFRNKAVNVILVPNILYAKVILKVF